MKAVCKSCKKLKKIYANGLCIVCYKKAYHAKLMSDARSYRELKKDG